MSDDYVCHDRILEREADEHEERQQRLRDESYAKMLNSPSGQRVMAGLPPYELACDFCPSMDAKDFDGVAVCKKCCDDRDTLRICRECGETEFIDGPEGPTMCVWCRSIDSDYAPEWEDGE
jgi:hypothetical protein